MAGLRSSAFTTGQSNADDYFASMGLDPHDYSSTIQNTLNSIMAGISPDDPNPGGYFSNVGETVYDKAQTGARNKYARTFDDIFAPNFETQRIADTADDPVLAAINAQMRGDSDTYLNNLLSRGVITATGLDAGEKNLDRQSSAVMARLNEIGNTELASGRSKLTGIANKGRQAADTYKLGSQFDPYQYSTDVDAAFADFMNSLGGNIRAKAQGNFYDTSGLAAIAGQGQGAQNTKFSPNALAGITDNEDDQNRQSSTNVF